MDKLHWKINLHATFLPTIQNWMMFELLCYHLKVGLHLRRRESRVCHGQVFPTPWQIFGTTLGLKGPVTRRSRHGTASGTACVPACGGVVRVCHGYWCGGVVRCGTVWYSVARRVHGVFTVCTACARCVYGVTHEYFWRVFLVVTNLVTGKQARCEIFNVSVKMITLST